LKIDQKVLENLKNLADKQKNDPRLRIIREKSKNDPTDNKRRIEEGVLFRRGRQGAIWKAMLPECFGAPINQYVHTSLMHAGVDKCGCEINQSFHLKSVGRQVRRLIASCDICQRVKHSNRSLDIEERSHVPNNPRELCSVHLYGPLPTGRGGVRYILICFEVFSKYVMLYPLKTATTMSCLNKLINRYFLEVVKPKVLLSDKGTQFQSPFSKGTI
jgi:hypothetical protein